MAHVVAIAKSFAPHVVAKGMFHVLVVMVMEINIVSIAMAEVKKFVTYVKVLGFNLMD